MKLCSPCNGKVKLLEEVKDEAFAQKMLGDGIVVVPSDGVITSPVKGKITMIFPTHHALGIVSEDGIEVLLHIGIDTVSLEGQGFVCHVSEGDCVEIGTKLVTCDLDVMKKASLENDVMIIITNTTSYETIQPCAKEETKRGDSILIVE